MSWYFASTLKERLAAQAQAQATTPEAIAAAGEGLIEGKAPENAIIVRRQTAVDVQNEDRFSPVNSFAFNPMAQEYMTIDNAVLAALLLAMYKKSPANFARLASKYMDNVTDLLQSIIATGKAHPLTAINANTTFAVVAHRFGVITDSGYLKIVDHTRSIIDKLIQLSAAGMALNGLETLVESGLGKGRISRRPVGALSDLKALKP